MQEKKVSLYLKNDVDRMLLTTLQHEMIPTGFQLSRIGDSYSLAIGNSAGGVDIQIPREWMTEIMINLVLTLDRGDALKVVQELEDKLLS